MKRTLSLLSIFLFISFPLAQTTFSSAQIINSSVTGARDVYSGDLDGDGDTDVLSASAGDGTFDWYENDGTGNFGEKQTIHTGTYDHPFSVLTIDMDNDGDLDVVSSANGNVSWHENNGDATSFNSYDISVASGNTYAVHAADIDDDGDVDVFAPSYGHNKVYWYENDGSENFTRHIIATTINGAFYVFTTDLDSDGDQDVLACGLGNQVAWLENDGNENFTTHTITTNITAATSVHSSDVDGDGDMDVLSSSRGDDRIAWYENDGNQNFTTHIITSSADVAYSVLSLDIDNDGDIDVISASEGDNKVAWYENDGNENFTTHVITTSANLPGAVHADDIDGDGDNIIDSADSDLTLKPTPFSLKDNKATAQGFAFDLGYPILRGKSLSLEAYMEFNKLIFPAVAGDAYYSRKAMGGTGITVPGVRASLFSFLNVSFEYRIKQGFFAPQFFDGSYDLSRVVAEFSEDGTIIRTKDQVVLVDSSNTSGMYGSASADLFNLVSFSASYASMKGEGDVEFNSFNAMFDINAENIPKLSVAQAYYLRNNDKNPFDFSNPSINTIFGYKVGYEVNAGVSLIWDFRQFYRDTGNGLEPIKQTTIETAFNF